MAHLNGKTVDGTDSAERSSISVAMKCGASYRARCSSGPSVPWQQVFFCLMAPGS